MQGVVFAVRAAVLRLRGRLLVTVGWAVCVSIARAQEPQYFQPPSSSSRFVFRWDALARYDSIFHLRARPDIERGRFEFRPELDWETSDRFKIGVRAVGDLGTDANVENARNFDNYRSRGATVERYFVEAKPGPVVLLAGAFAMPLVSTEMLWDRDIQTPGAAVAWEIPAGRSTFTLAGAGFYGPQREGDRTRIGAGQIVWRTGDPDRFEAQVAGSYWSFDPRELKAPYIRQNYFDTDTGQRRYVSDFRIADLIVRLRFPIGRVPVTISLDGFKNYGVREEAATDGDAFEGRISIGRLGNRWDWRVFYTYQYVERDAVIGAYNTDDWWFHSWYRGSRAGVAVTILPRVFVQGTVMFQRRLDLPTTLNRITVDLVKMF
jgi:hypothetical protein